AQLSTNEQEMAQRLDLLQFQQHELTEANLSPDEDEQLEKERDYLMNYERIFNALNEAYTALYGEQKGLEWLNRAQQSLQDDCTVAQRPYDILDQLIHILLNKLST